MAVVISVTSLGAARLTIAPTLSPGSRASASTKKSRAMRSRASSAALRITMPPELVPARITSLRSSKWRNCATSWACVPTVIPRRTAA